MDTPKELGYYFPAEWTKHEATWLSWPHNLETWPKNKLGSILKTYVHFISLLAEGELVRININKDKYQKEALDLLKATNIDLNKIEFFINKTNDAWCRDHGPSFIINPKAINKKAIVDWNFNSWGGKYPFDLDNKIPRLIADKFNLPLFTPKIVMEGGSVDFNGEGTILTTTSCLLNQNRNQKLNKRDIEKYLINYYGAEQILWLKDGIKGDDTDGHIDDITRFVNTNTVITMIEEDKYDDNYDVLKENLKALNTFRLPNGQQLEIIEIPMPKPVKYNGERLPASYANFYISNYAVIVPTFEDKNDQVALEILQRVFPDRKVIGLDSRDIIIGLGSFHCLTQQEPVE